MDVITASGTGQVSVPPDSLRVNLGVQVKAATMEEVLREANTAMARMLAALHALDIPNLTLQTDMVRLDPIYEKPEDSHPDRPRPSGPPALLGYSASNSVNATVRRAPADQLAGYASRIVDTALQAGANTTSRFQLFVDDPSDAEARALAEAVRGARRAAEIVAQAAEVTITRVHKVDVGESLSPRLRRAVGFGGGFAAPEIPVETGEITIRRSVTARFVFR